MLKLKVTEKSGAVCEYQAPAELDYSALGHGKPERWVPASEPHDPADVLETEQREVQPAEGEQPAVMQEWVKLRAEYTVSVHNLEEDPEWLLQQCHQKRLNEYPSLGEFADAYVKMQSGDSSQMNAYVAKCIEVKQKYPKP